MWALNVCTQCGHVLRLSLLRGPTHKRGVTCQLTATLPYQLKDLGLIRGGDVAVGLYAG